MSNMLRGLVLGGKGDIGSAIVKGLSADGVHVDAVGISDFDLSSLEQIEQFFSARKAKFDILVHCAGFNLPKLIEELSEQEIRYSLDVNLHGFLAVAQRCLPYWQQLGYGRVLVIGSLYSHFARSKRLPYVMAKHALDGAVKTMAIEWARYGVVVNALSPGYVDTRMTRSNNSPEVIANIQAGIPLGRLATPEDIADVAVFLCSKRNRYLSGQNIIVDGGYSAGGFQG
jgi:3-oxoacyl-[acyl-carrier protein] reductase